MLVEYFIDNALTTCH
jgi:Ase1/PRC1/MAP65 family protein